MEGYLVFIMQNSADIMANVSAALDSKTRDVLRGVWEEDSDYEDD